MQYGLFTMPSHPPECGLFEGHRWDLQTLRWADELGFCEGWIGEHHTAPWEPHPSPDLLIAQSLMETERIRLAPGGFLFSITWLRGGSILALPPAACRATGRCSMSTATPGNIVR